ncbi:uncharacterized protein BX664DRAFT_332348 [Halteromyces radiatus]|uniref:uncharacterized protein n=1 Tax=Halteromyces radiatus TaxID=101107 RepID=UPI0022207155|nr:uncharacterized protein BX664DRAFT_332348 [Halteromyces radiatus]KAI8089169.1 hypothetical protein BX664DRAFT_332348 [Halteromyces radiatus]
MYEKGLTSQKNSASKYDFVKVRVHLSEQHYYVLSRFILCRMLTAAQINYVHALRIALDLKKRLVDKGCLDVSQQNLERELFDLIKQHGYGAMHIQWYQTMSSFHHQRIPLVILLAGTSLTGKSTMATRLSERLNLSSVLKTDVIYDLMHTIIEGTTPPRLWNMNGDRNTFLRRMTKECQLVCKGLDTDVCKSIADGKSVIIEGDLVDHGLLDRLYEYLIQQHGQKQQAIVVPLLLTVADPTKHQELVQQSRRFSTQTDDNVILDRMRAWQDQLLAIHHQRQQQAQPTFQVVQMDMDRLPLILDQVQAIVLEKITLEMSSS